MSEPLKLTGSQKEILMKGIVGAYPEPDDLWILLAVRMEVKVSAIAREGTYNTKVFGLVQDFEANGTIEEFIRVVVNDKPESPYLKSIKNEFASILGKDNTDEKNQQQPPKRNNGESDLGGQDGRFNGNDSQMKKILILASNPRKDLNLDEEIRLVRNAVAQSCDQDQYDQDQIKIVSEPGVIVGDLQRLLLQHKPEIVHFCGHGGGEEGLIFKIEGGGEQWVKAEALADMFRLKPICSHVKCVLLNACYSEKQAEAIVKNIDYVVGMSHEIGDNAAIAFSKGFYLALGYGCSIEDSFEFGKNAIQLEISGSSKKRSATVSEDQRKLNVIEVVTNTSIPEHLKPILKKKTSLNIRSSNPTLSQENRADIQLVIDKTLEEDAKKQYREQGADIQLVIDKTLEEDANVKKYREQVKRYLSDHILEDFERDFLNVSIGELGLSPEKANQILEEELAPIYQARQAYESRLKAVIKYYPFSNEVKNILKNFQEQLNLTDGEVDEISQSTLEQAERSYQQKLRQEEQLAYDNKRKHYEQEFTRAINAGYPIEDLFRESLRSFQHSLELSDEDIERIERPIIDLKYQARQAYESRLKAVIKYYPFSNEVKDELKNFQTQWNLTDKEVDEISKPTLEQAEIAYQEKLQQQAQQEEKARELSRPQEALERQKREEAQHLIVAPAPTSSVLQSARGIDYQKLEELLKQQKWKEADGVTHDVMLEVANRSSEGWLGFEDIYNFPFEDLRTIDGLWVKYSNGHFGFSVQAKIYYYLGGTREYNEKVWNAFGDKVGWCVNKGWLKGVKWMNYSEMTFDLQSPQGHLPSECVSNYERFYVSRDRERARGRSFLMWRVF